MATPHVVGVVARVGQRNPCATPSDVASAITSHASIGKVTSPGALSPNLLLNTAFIGPNVSVALPCPLALSASAGYNVSHLTWTTPGGGTSPVNLRGLSLDDSRG